MPVKTEIFQVLKETVTRFVQERLMPIEREVDESGVIPASLIQEMRNLGFFGLTIPTKYGGLGLCVEEEVRLVFEFGRTSPAFHTVFGTNNGIGSEGIVFAGTAAQKSTYLPRLASGEIIGAFALTEPDTGSDAAAISMSAKKAKDGWVLNGTKRYITNAPIAGLFTVLARTGSVQDRAAGISAFLVKANSKGLSTSPPIRKMGHHGSTISDVIFDDCFVPYSQMLGKQGKGLSIALSVIDRGRLRVAALCVGIADRLMTEAIQYAKQRQQFGSSIANHQLIQAKLADSETEIYAGKSMVIATAKSIDAGENARRAAACCKYFCSEMVGKVADRTLQIYGGAGYICDYNVERFYRDVRLFRLYEGTSEIQQLAIARDLLRD